MAKKDFYIDIDLNKSSFLNAKIQRLGSHPGVNGTTDTGFIYFNTEKVTAYIWTGSASTPNTDNGWLDLGQVYAHPDFPGNQVPASPLVGAYVPTALTLDNGHVTGMSTRILTPDDIDSAWADHTHTPADIVGLPNNTILGNNSGVTGPASVLTVAQVLAMLGLTAGTLSELNAGTNNSQKTWTPKVISDFVLSKIGNFLTEVNLTLTQTNMAVTIVNDTPGTNVTIPEVNHTYAGVMSSKDKQKLDGIQADANYYVHPTENPGDHPFATQLTAGLQILSQLVVNNEGHVIQIKGRNLTASDIATVMFNNGINNGTNTTWTSTKIHQEIQDAINQAQTGALSYQGEYNPLTNTPNVILPATGVKIGWTYVVNTSGTFAGQEVEAGDMIIAKVDNPGSTPANWQIVNKNIPAIVDATTTIKGIIQLATNTEGIAGTNNTKAITSSVLKAVLDARVGGYVADFGNGSGTSFTITHNAGTQDVIAVVYRKTDRKVIEVAIAYPSVNTVTVDMNVAPANNAYRIVIKK